MQAIAVLIVVMKTFDTQNLSTHRTLKAVDAIAVYTSWKLYLDHNRSPQGLPTLQPVVIYCRFKYSFASTESGNNPFSFRSAKINRRK